MHFSMVIDYKRTCSLCTKQCLLATNYENGDDANIPYCIWQI